jgi:hypothetical protein
MKTPFNQSIANMICEMVASNNSLVTICSLDYMPDLASITEWLNHDSPQCLAFAKAYRFAQEVRADYLFEEVIEIADDTSEDEIEVTNRQGEVIGTKENREFVNRSKLRVQTRLDVIAKMNAKKYGKKAEEIVSDKDKLKDLIAVMSKGPAK